MWFQNAEDVVVCRFGTSAYDDPMAVSTKLKQASNVLSYKSQFEALSNRVKGLSEPHMLSCFLSGLKDEIRLSIRMLAYKTLNTAFGLARIQEEYLNSSRKSLKSVQDNGTP